MHGGGVGSAAGPLAPVVANQNHAPDGVLRDGVFTIISEPQRR